MRVLVVGHAFAVPSNRARWERFTELYPDTVVTVVVPAEHRTSRYGEMQVFRTSPEENPTYRVVPIPTSPRGLYRSMSLELRRARPDIIQVNEEPSEWPLLQCLVAARALVPDATRLFYFWTNLLNRPRAPWNRLKLHVDFRLAQAAVVGSEDSADVLRALGFGGPCIVQTELGADERQWVPRDQRPSSQPFTVGFVGSLLPEKGVADLARAVVTLRGDWRLVVCGDGPEHTEIERILAGSGFGHHLTMMGLVPRDRLPAIVRTFDALVLPSRTTPAWQEQFGLVLAEAMLCGVPVVGSDSGAIPGVIGNAGMVFPEGRWESLRDQLQNLMDNPSLRADLATRGRERALERYSVTALAHETHSVYEDLLAGRPA